VSEIKIEKLSQEKIDEMGYLGKRESTFDWFYDMQETCYILEGNARVDLRTASLSHSQKA